MIDLSNPHGTVFGLMPKEWRLTMLEYYRNGGKVEWFSGNDWQSRSAGIVLYNNAYRAAPDPLIPDSIDWSHVSDEFICMARDVNGNVYLYGEPPRLSQTVWLDNGTTCLLRGFKSLKIGNMPWDQSLVWRPGYGPEGKQ